MEVNVDIIEVTTVSVYNRQRIDMFMCIAKVTNEGLMQAASTNVHYDIKWVNLAYCEISISKVSIEN